MNKKAILFKGNGTDVSDMRYSSGFAAPDDFLFIVCGDRRICCVSPLEYDRARTSVLPGVEVRRNTGSAVEAVKGLCAELGLSALTVPENFPLGLAEKLRAAAAEGSLTGIPAAVGDSMQELTDRYRQLTDWDGIEDGRLFALEGGCFRGVYLITDNLTKGWENSKVQGIRMDQGCLWGLSPGETLRSEWLAELGDPDGSAEIGEDRAEANRLVPGTCDYYRCGEYLLQLYSDMDGTLFSIILAE